MGTASPRMTRMPVPKVAPTLIIVSWKTPKVLRRPDACPVCISAAMELIDFRRPSCRITPVEADGGVDGCAKRSYEYSCIDMNMFSFGSAAVAGDSGCRRRGSHTPGHPRAQI